MRRIFKYRLPPVGYAGLGVHGPDPKVLAVGWQGEQLVVWMEVDVDEPAQVHHFEVVMTGDAAPVVDGADTVYVGTAQSTWDGAPYVVHVYRWIPR